jgi:hypothetical protein
MHSMHLYLAPMAYILAIAINEFIPKGLQPSMGRTR